MFLVMKKLFALGVEARGVERVLPEDREQKGALDSLTLWFSVNAVLTTVPSEYDFFSWTIQGYKVLNSGTLIGLFINLILSWCTRSTILYSYSSSRYRYNLLFWSAWLLYHCIH